MDLPLIDLARHLPNDPNPPPELWPTVPQPNAVHQTGNGLTAFASHSRYEQPADCLISDSDQRMLLSIWPKGGMDVAVDGRQQQLQSRQLLCGTLAGGPWHTHMTGDMPHVGLLVSPALLRQIAGDDGDALARDLERGIGLWITPSDLRLLHAAQELDNALMGGASSPLLRESKSLEFLIQVLRVRGTARSDGVFTQTAVVRRSDHERLHHARSLLLADLAQPPSIADLARQCGMNTFKLKQVFKQHFGLPVHALYQRERMRAAWDLIATGGLSVSQAGLKLGYTNMSHFSSAFKRVHDVLPNQVKRGA